MSDARIEELGALYERDAAEAERQAHELARRAIEQADHDAAEAACAVLERCASDAALQALIELFVLEEYEPGRPAKDALARSPHRETSARLAALLPEWLENDRREKRPGSIAACHALAVLGE